MVGKTIRLVCVLLLFDDNKVKMARKSGSCLLVLHCIYMKTRRTFIQVKKNTKQKKHTIVCEMHLENPRMMQATGRELRPY